MLSRLFIFIFTFFSYGLLAVELEEIAGFVIANKYVTEVTDFSPKIEFKTRVGNKSAEEEFGDNKVAGYVVATIPLWDVRNKREREQRILTENSKIIETVTSFLLKVKDCQYKLKRVDFLNYRIERSKKRVEQGISYLDEQLDLEELLHENKRELQFFVIEIDKLKALLVEMIDDKNKEALKSLLQKHSCN